MTKKIDFSNPIKGRKWLNILSPSAKYGLTLKKNLHLSKKKFGFSYSTNQWGLKGTGNIFANNVICGTSFAMGLCVDDGKNWYEYLDSEKEYFNIGMPVSSGNHLACLNDLYKGEGRVLIYLYHPNQWITSRNFYDAKKAGKDIFKKMKWETSFAKTIFLYLRFIPKRFIKKKLGYIITYKYKNKRYKINTKYSFYDLNSSNAFLLEEMYDLDILFRKFNKVLIVRVPIKEQLINEKINNRNLKKVCKNYEDNWQYFKTKISAKSFVLSDLSGKFELEDYFTDDTHLTEVGNIKLFDEIKKSLDVLNII